MFRKVFTITNNYSVNTCWKKQNLRPSFEERVGICSGMVVFWIKRSIASKGEGVQNADEFNTASISVIQASYVWKHLFPSKSLGYGAGIPFLLQSQNLISVDNTAGEMVNTVPCIPEWMLTKTGHFILVFFKRAGDDSVYDGHSIGFRYEVGALEMLEPNNGLFRYSDIPNFELHMSIYLERKYKHYDGKWYLHKVELDS